MEKNNIAKYVLAGIIVVSIAVVMGFMFTHNENKEYTSTISLCVGTLLGAFTTVYTYEFGSSKGSAEKNSMIYHSTPTVPPINPEEETLIK